MTDQTFKILNFKQHIQVPFVKIATFRKSPIGYVSDYYQTDNNKYTTMGIVCNVMNIHILSGSYDLHDGISVHLQIVALVYRPVVGQKMLVHLLKGRTGDIIGRIIDNDINSTVRFIEPPPQNINLNDQFLMWIKVESWQCQLMDKIVIIGDPRPLTN